MLPLIVVDLIVAAALGALLAHLSQRGRLARLQALYDNLSREAAGEKQARLDLQKQLEDKVLERTADLQQANQALQHAYEELKRAETSMALASKMASLGQLVAGIAHEINTPSSAISAAIFNISAYLDTLTRQMPMLGRAGVPPEAESLLYGLVEKALHTDFPKGRPSTADIRRRTRDTETLLQLRGFTRSRELALAFSRLALHDDLVELIQKLPSGSPVVHEFLENVGSLAVAVNDIRLSIDALTRMVKALRSYSHLDQAEMAETDLHDGIETTLAMLRSAIRYGIVVERRYKPLPNVLCSASELNQVWTNLIYNGVQAMHGMGTLTIETGREEDFAVVRISDTGPGISSDILPRIFEPFFTTKEPGVGTGLGLGICQQIVHRHQGVIRVASEPGRTCFEVRLPLAPQPAALSA